MRKSDADNATHFRSGDRVFCLNGSWYFQTRENDHGPFPTREAAELNLKRYVEEMSFFDDVRKSTPTPPVPAKDDPEFANFSLVDKD